MSNSHHAGVQLQAQGIKVVKVSHQIFKIELGCNYAVTISCDDCVIHDISHRCAFYCLCFTLPPCWPPLVYSQHLQLAVTKLLLPTAPRLHLLSPACHTERACSATLSFSRENLGSSLHLRTSQPKGWPRGSAYFGQIGKPLQMCNSPFVAPKQACMYLS